jgi:quercetin dioxygenase-like cupin family protein
MKRAIALFAATWLGAAACGSSQSAAQGPAAAAPTEPAASDVDAEEREAQQIEAIAAAVRDDADQVHACYKRAAALDYRLDGTVVLAIEFGDGGRVGPVVAVTDEVGSETLRRCLVELYEKVPFAPVFAAGDVIQLPLRFVAHAAQYTVDRLHVPTRELGPGAETSVILHGGNTGNAAVSLAWVELAPAAVLELPGQAAREILYVIEGGGALAGTGGQGKQQPVGAGAAVYLAGSAGQVFRSGDRSTRLVRLTVPGGAEPGGAGRGARAAPRVRAPGDWLPIAGGAGAVAILFDAESAGDAAAYVGVLRAQPGMTVPEHTHPGSTELLYVLSGTGIMTVEGDEHPVHPGMGIQIPPDTRHAFAVTSAGPVEVVQFYTPSGPEQRFKQAPR